MSQTPEALVLQISLLLCFKSHPHTSQIPLVLWVHDTTTSPPATRASLQHQSPCNTSPPATRVYLQHDSLCKASLPTTCWRQTVRSKVATTSSRKVCHSPSASLAVIWVSIARRYNQLETGTPFSNCPRHASDESLFHKTPSPCMRPARDIFVSNIFLCV
jgi:hypothetical protein